MTEVTSSVPERVESSVWVAYATVMSITSAPYIGFLTNNLGEPVDYALVAQWWLLTTGGGLLLVVVAQRRAGPEVARWAGVAVALIAYQSLLFPVQEVATLLRGRLVDLAWPVVSVTLLVGLWRWGRSRHMQVFVAMLSVGLLLNALIPAATEPLTELDPPARLASERTLTEAPKFTRTPNVWYFVLDGHPSLDYFVRETSYDANGFSMGLTDRGFTVQTEAESNYPVTYVSIASVLEMDYLHVGAERPPFRAYYDSIRGASETMLAFKAAGYSYVHAYPGIWGGSRCTGVEYFCTGDEAQINSTALALRRMTPIPGLGEQAVARDVVAQANDPSAVVNEVLRADVPSPSFTFVHLLNPHPPFLRDSDCGIRSVGYELGNWETPAALAGVAQCLHRRLLEAVDAIVVADPDAVIIIQGDHGHRLPGEDSVRSDGAVDGDEWFETLSAMRLPPDCDVPGPDQEFALVNTFRVVFACLLDDSIELLPMRRIPMVQN